MTTWQWVTCNSAGLQAVAAAVGVLVAFIGLVVLCVYAWDTRTIAEAASNQAKDSVIPFIALDITWDSPDDPISTARSWKMENHGLGPAMNISIWLLNDEKPKQRLSLMKGSVRKILDFSGPENDLFHERMRRERGVVAEYESIAGERFRTTFKLRQDEGLHLTFENLSRKR